eukprot:m.430829 g.430829  ORF g.430829 m.430829 type:complete len:243 (+) comp21399_c2_seq6:574-1302(+)
MFAPKIVLQVPRNGCFDSERIPGAIFWDCDAVSDPLFSAAPHNLPTPTTFAENMAELGIDKNTVVVVYDQHGIFSAPRFWYTLSTFGHANVAVLNGGLPQWRAKGLPLESSTDTETNTSTATRAAATWEKDEDMQWNIGRTLANISAEHPVQIVDARSNGRFRGTEPEPRPGMRGGHIPGSRSVPFSAVLMTDPETNVTVMKPEAEIRAVFEDAASDQTALNLPSLEFRVATATQVWTFGNR